MLRIEEGVRENARKLQNIEADISQLMQMLVNIEQLLESARVRTRTRNNQSDPSRHIYINRDHNANVNATTVTEYICSSSGDDDGSEDGRQRLRWNRCSGEIEL